jgi:hypothetical protein
MTPKKYNRTMLQLDKFSQERSRRPTTTRLTTLQTTHMASKKGEDPALPEHAYRQTRIKHHTLDESGINKAYPLDNGKHKDRNGVKEIQVGRYFKSATGKEASCTTRAYSYKRAAM